MLEIPKQDGLTFDEALHEYRFRGARILSITQILRSVGISPSFDGVNASMLAAYATRGTHIHSICEYSDLDDLGDYDSSYQPYLDAWLKFKKDFDFRPELIEQVLYHPVYKYALRLDRAGRLGDRKAVVEIKSGEGPLEDWIECQLMGQQIALEDVAKFGPISTRIAVKLHKDGSYSIREYKDHRARGVTLAAVAVANWKLGKK